MKYLLIAAAIVLVGCSTNAKKEEPKAPPPPVVITYKPDSVQRDLAIAWENEERGGAAIRQSAFIHVLGSDGMLTPGHALEERPLAAISPAAPSSSVQSGAGLGVDTASAARPTAQRSYSVYELARWERFCNAGKNMDERDWRFIQQEGTGNVPVDVLSNCRPPSFSFHDYFNAWRKHCEGEVLVAPEQNIVYNTVRPRSMIGSCDTASVK